MPITIDSASPASCIPQPTQSLHQLCKEVCISYRKSLRNYSQNIEQFRELESREQEKFTAQKVASFRSITPTIMRIGIATLGAVTAAGTIVPGPIRHTFDWLSTNAPAIFSREQFNSLTNAAGVFNYIELQKMFSSVLSAGQEALKAGLEIKSNHEQADRTEIDANFNKSKELENRRIKEANERRQESDEMLQLLQQLNREIAEAIKSIARH